MQLGALEYLISIDNRGLTSGINEAENKIKKSATNVSRKLQDVGGKLTAWTVAKGQMIANFAERTLSTLGNTAKAVISTAIESYAEYEQLVGGVETLFKTSSDKVMKYAERAYMTAGLSANEYMSTVTSFSASLLQSLGGDTEKAADVADMALQDMSDNANKMGTSMDSIQNAYQGFAKQNYTMLDNLKLGYGGTKSEMERLLKDAEKITGVHYDIKNLSDVYEAIHVIQTELGITGTTQEEAEKTISGSLARLKASWKNLLTAIADPNGDIDKALDAVFKSVKTVITRLRPVIRKAIKSFVQTFNRALPDVLKLVASDIIPGVVDVLKDVIDEAKRYGAVFKKTLAQWLQIENPDQASWIEIGGKIGTWVRQGIGNLLHADADGNGETTWAEIAKSIFTALEKQLTDEGFAGKVLSAFIDRKDKLIDFARGIIEGAVDFLTNPETIGDVVALIEKVATSLAELATPIADAIVSIINNVILSPDVWNAILVLGDRLIRAVYGDDSIIANIIGKPKKLAYEVGEDGRKHTTIVDDEDAKASVGLVRSLAHAAIKAVFGEEAAGTDVAKFFENVINGGGIVQYGINELVKAIRDNVAPILDSLKPIWDGISETFTTTWNQFKISAVIVWEWLKNKVTAIWDGVTETVLNTWNLFKVGALVIWNWVKEKATAIWDKFKEFAINPTFDGLIDLVEEAWTAITEAITTIWNSWKTVVFDPLWNNIKGTAEDVWNEIVTTVTGAWETAKAEITGVWNTLKSTAESIWADITGTVTRVWNEGVTAVTGIWELIKAGAEQAWLDIVATVERIWATVSSAIIAPFKPILKLLGIDVDGTSSGKTIASTVASGVTDAVNAAENEVLKFFNLPRDMIVNVKLNMDKSSSRWGFDPSWFKQSGSAFTPVQNGRLPLLNAKGNWAVPYDNYPALLHRDEMVLTKSQARRYRDGDGGMDYAAIGGMIGSSMRRAMQNVNVMMSGEKVGDLTTRRVKKNINASNFAKLRAMGG